MRRQLEKLHWNDRSKLVIAAAAAGAVLLFALLFPLLFLPGAEDSTEIHRTLDDRSRLFARYWSEKGGETDISVETTENPKPETAALCTARMDGIIALCIPDQALEELTPSGSEYQRISGGQTELNCCRMWLERSGDWKNWLDVCMDADTGELYYLYLSCACLTAENADTDAVNERIASLAETLAVYMDGEVRFTEAKAGGQSFAITTPNGTICYSLECAVSERLIDLRLISV